ncbi:hypothetical protein N657DRAFT_613932 [Parathielavia appendiculata]|uniref:DUF7704 domain-containing protein n=1 Tax=Parathielavia appendiculata TaxID=2587402 RepID=A0AAN6U3Q1_9PEZI|nr:hypothetical protein N657DRAFT_613932 [Parathielavia appendiculata]
MARTTLPTFPLIVFGVIEPALLTWAYIEGMCDPRLYFLKQVPNTTGSPGTAAAFSPEALGVTLQLLNVWLLLALMAVVACFSRDPATAKGYLLAVALADWGHIYATYRAIGADVFFDPSQWNDMVWGGIGVSGVLNVLRWLTLLGVLGPVVARDTDGKRKTP